MLEPMWRVPAWSVDANPGEESVYAPPHKEPVYAKAYPGRIGDWIQVHSGAQAYPMDLRPSEVEITDIAHSLSMQCRYTGHCLRFYSVAEHSVLMARWVPPADAMYALLHDASEAYLTDVPRPIKPFLPGYKEAERRVQDAVWKRFGLKPGNPYSVDTADARILNDERAQNMAPSAVEWVMPSPEPLGVTLQFWTPEQAEAEFLACYWGIIESGRM
jgi:hypothetical protein